MAGRRLQIRVIACASVAVAVLCIAGAGRAAAVEEGTDDVDVDVRVLLFGTAPANGQELEAALDELEKFGVVAELDAVSDLEGWRDLMGGRTVEDASSVRWSGLPAGTDVLVLAPGALNLSAADSAGSAEADAVTPSDGQGCEGFLTWRPRQWHIDSFGVPETSRVLYVCTSTDLGEEIQALEVAHAELGVDPKTEVQFDTEGHASITVTGLATGLPRDVLQLSSASLEPVVPGLAVSVEGWDVMLDVEPGTTEIEEVPKTALQLVLTSSVAEVPELDPYEIDIAPWQAQGTGGGSNRTLLLVGLVAIAAAVGAGTFLTMRRKANPAVVGPGGGSVQSRVGGDIGLRHEGNTVDPDPPPPPPPPPNVRPAPLPPPSDRKTKVIGLWPKDEVEGGEVPRTKIRWILPETIDERARVWVHPDQLAFGAFSEKVQERGEDADPVLMTSSVDGGVRLLGVFDGMGGAGSGRVTCADGEKRTQAYLASRLVRDALTEWSGGLFDGGQVDVADLHARIEHVLHDRRDDWQLEGKSNLKGGLRRTLPTTMAVALVEAPPRRKAVVTAYWAGDSRAFLLTPTAGLQQLTADHTRERDVLAQLTDDPPITNVVSASQTFTIEQTSVSVSEPFVVVCATDGVFGYVQTPGEVEFHMLDTLEQARDLRDWSTLLLQRVLGYTADDATLVMSAVGFRSLRELRTSFRQRLERVRETQVAPFTNAQPGDQEAVRAARQIAWDEYREAYTRLMPTTAPPSRGR